MVKRRPRTEPWGTSALRGLGKEEQLTKETQKEGLTKVEGKTEEFGVLEAK